LRASSSDEAKAAWFHKLDHLQIKGHNGNAQQPSPFLDFVAGTAKSTSSRWHGLMTSDHEADRNRRSDAIRQDIRNGASHLLEQVVGSVWNDTNAAQKRAVDFVTKTAEVTTARIAQYDSNDHLDSEKMAALQDAAAELRRKLRM
jgi:hypothetical protein